MGAKAFSHYARCHAVAREAVVWPHVEVSRGRLTERRNVTQPGAENYPAVSAEYGARVTAVRDGLIAATKQDATVGQIRAVAFPSRGGAR
jgi:hypothetical protein